MNKKRKIAFYTLGCKLNFSETSKISREFSHEKFERIDFKEKADIYVINTCAVTEKAEKKSLAAINKLKKRNPDAIIAAVGCYSELNKKSLLNNTDVDIVLGTSDKFSLPQYLNDNCSDLGLLEKTVKISNNSFIPSYSINERTRSFLKIQDGCDYFCSYCTVPLARGESRSDTIENTIKTANEIAAYDIKEIILTGVNVGDFGRKNGEKLIELLKRLDNIGKFERIRISSIEPDLLTSDIIEFVASSKKILPHFHIPLQSASDKVLQAMKRRYNIDLFSDKIEHIKKYMPESCVAVDIIVGFPSETEKDFEDTFNYLESSDISYMHVFAYSERKNTSAFNMHNIVSEIEKTNRSKRLLTLSEKKKLFFYNQNKGKEKHVLWESDNDNGFMYGFTENYLKVKTIFNSSFVNKVMRVKLENITNDGIFIVSFLQL